MHRILEHSVFSKLGKGKPLPNIKPSQSPSKDRGAKAKQETTQYNVYIPPVRSSIYHQPDGGTGAARPSEKENKFHVNTSPSGELKIKTGGDSHFKQTPSRNPLLLLRKSEPHLQ